MCKCSSTSSYFYVCISYVRQAQFRKVKVRSAEGAGVRYGKPPLEAWLVEVVAARGLLDGHLRLKELIEGLNSGTTVSQHVQVAVAPSFLHIEYAGRLKRSFEMAAQDCSKFGRGAFTADVNAEQLRDYGIQWVILGHSEMRKHHRDTDQDVAVKMAQAQKFGLRVCACVGETLEERKNGQTHEVVRKQVMAICEATTAWDNLVIAYEPRWAIGTNLAATPDQAQDRCRFVRSIVSATYGEDVANGLRIIYGGSVKPYNAKGLYRMPDIDGFLVGGASLYAQKFLDICHTVEVMYLQANPLVPISKL